LYNLDIRDEIFWIVEAWKSRLLRDISLLQMVNLAVHTGEKATRRLNNMWDEYYLLIGIDCREERERQEHADSWAWLEAKKRG